MNENDKIEKLAKALWEYYYPNGGSIFPTYESLSSRDKELMIEEARQIKLLLDGEARLILI